MCRPNPDFLHIILLLKTFFYQKNLFYFVITTNRIEVQAINLSSIITAKISTLQGWILTVNQSFKNCINYQT